MKHGLLIIIISVIMLQCTDKSYSTYIKDAEKLTKEGNIEEALKIYNKLVEDDYMYQELFYNRGVLFNQIGMYKYAYVDAQMAMSLDSSKSKYYILLGVVCNNVNRYSESIKNYIKAISIDSNYIGFQRISRVFADSGQYSLALNFINRAISNYSDSATLYNSRGLIYFNLSQMEHALKDLEKTILLDSSNHIYFYNIARIENELEDYTAVINNLNKAIDLLPYHEYYYFRGCTYVKVDSIYKACTDFKQALLKGNEKANKKIDLFCR